jgi:hypothetical protein
MVRYPFLRLWGMPLVLVILILFGLLAALLGTGIWHPLSWMALSVPMLTIAWYVLKKRQ